ncbi:MAG: hypothetical protein HY376_02215 [Candidatus Blackburnbacteria bacterium]|nr:hypothetical protein [Candidatus Blackburnbacteria bacterium]
MTFNRDLIENAKESWFGKDFYVFVWRGEKTTFIVGKRLSKRELETRYLERLLKELKFVPSAYQNNINEKEVGRIRL